MDARRNTRLHIVKLIGDATLLDIKAEHDELPILNSKKFKDSASKIVILGCPDYGNLGDHAISLAQRRFVESRLGISPVVFSGPLKRYWQTLPTIVQKGDIICLQGGGNMGTLYEAYENERLAIIDRFKSNKIILFPQTISYGDTVYEERYMSHMRRVYSRHSDLHLFARERMSLERMKRQFPNLDVALTPDIVLSLPPYVRPGNTARKGLGICLRSDKECRIGGDATRILADAAKRRFDVVHITDTMHQKDLLTLEEGEAAVMDKIEELSQSELVVTDRIHGMIFCALSGTPCIALDNSNGKVGMEFEWLRDIPYMRFAGNVHEASNMVQEWDVEPGFFPIGEFEHLFDPIENVLCGGLYGAV